MTHPRSLPLLALAASALLWWPACSDTTTTTKDGAAPDVGSKDMGVEALPDKGPKCSSYPDGGVPASCAKNTLEVFKGKYQLVMNKLQVAGLTEGFDLNNGDCDNNPLTGEKENVFALLGALADSALDEAMKNGEINIPFEVYDLDSTTSDDCFNYSIYVGRWAPDYDLDGDEAGGPSGKAGKDCNDLDKAINSKATEVAGNYVDDDCDGLADESGTTASTNADDKDGDGQTIAQGDCDDRTDDAAKKIYGSKIKKGGTEVCGDGLDNDCNGKADDTCMSSDWGMKMPVESLGLDTSQKESLITFRGATLKSGKLLAGPSIFGVKIEITKGVSIDFNLTHVFISADLASDTNGIKLSNGVLGGVLSARAMDQAPNFAEQVGIGNKTDSMLDAVLSQAGGTILALPKDKDGTFIPDIDVDGDGIEKFLDKDLDGDKAVHRVDTCVDGDGTIVQDTYDATTKKVLTRCTDAKDSSGNYRFKDGWSVAFKFSAVPGKIEGIVTTATK